MCKNRVEKAIRIGARGIHAMDQVLKLEKLCVNFGVSESSAAGILTDRLAELQILARVLRWFSVR